MKLPQSLLQTIAWQYNPGANPGRYCLYVCKNGNLSKNFALLKNHGGDTKKEHLPERNAGITSYKCHAPMSAAGHKNMNEFIPTRASLLSRLKNWDDHESWKVFFETYWKLIYSTAIKAGLTDSEAQDAVQETIISVMKSMPNFEYDANNGSFKAWLLRLTNWRIVDQFRKRQKGIQRQTSEMDDSTRTAIIENIMDPTSAKLELIWDEEWEKNLVDAAVERIKARVDPTQYQVFDLYVLKKWPVLKVARLLKINPGKVYLSKHRIGKLLKDEINHLRARPI